MTNFCNTLKERLQQIKIADKIKYLEKVDLKQAETLSKRTSASIEDAKAKLIPFQSKTLDQAVLDSRLATCNSCPHYTSNVCSLTGGWADIFASISVAKCPVEKWL